jgi:hypothetical protein
MRHLATALDECSAILGASTPPVCADLLEVIASCRRVARELEQLCAAAPGADDATVDGVAAEPSLPPPHVEAEGALGLDGEEERECVCTVESVRVKGQWFVLQGPLGIEVKLRAATARQLHNRLEDHLVHCANRSLPSSPTITPTVEPFVLEVFDEDVKDFAPLCDLSQLHVKEPERSESSKQPLGESLSCRLRIRPRRRPGAPARQQRTAHLQLAALPERPLGRVLAFCALPALVAVDALNRAFHSAVPAVEASARRRLGQHPLQLAAGALPAGPGAGAGRPGTGAGRPGTGARVSGPAFGTAAGSQGGLPPQGRAGAAPFGSCTGGARWRGDYPLARWLGRAKGGWKAECGFELRVRQLAANWCSTSTAGRSETSHEGGETGGGGGGGGGGGAGGAGAGTGTGAAHLSASDKFKQAVRASGSARSHLRLAAGSPLLCAQAPGQRWRPTHRALAPALYLAKVSALALPSMCWFTRIGSP